MQVLANARLTCVLSGASIILLSFSSVSAQPTSFSIVPVWASAPSNNSRGLALADVDLDGDLDIVFANDPGGNALYLNADGVLETTPAWVSAPIITSNDAVFGDVDGDGNPDLVSGNTGAGSVLYRNQGGTFGAAPVWTSLVNTTLGLELGDVDNDGDLDLVCANFGESNTLYINNGGVLADTASWMSGPANATTAVSLGDIDGDGALDLVCGNRTQPNVMYLNVGGMFSIDPVWVSTTTDSTTSITLGDVNGDGALDLVCGNFDAPNTLYLNEGTSFSPTPVWSSALTDTTLGVSLGDVDGDGDLDLVCGNLDQSNTLYINEAGVLSTTPIWRSGPTNSTYAVALADLDGDGDCELACANQGANTAYQNEALLFPVRPDWLSDLTNSTRGVALGDINGDGNLDLVCGNRSASNTLYLNQGGIFPTTPQWQSMPTNETYDVSLGDMDGDGDLDAVFGNRSAGNTMYRNTAGIFSLDPAWTSFPARDTREVAVGDVDRDGDLDVVCGNWGAPNALYLNSGGLLGSNPAWLSGPAYLTYGLALGDVNGDGFLDMVYGNFDDPNTLYLFNDPLYPAVPDWLSGLASGTNSVALGDLDGDRDLDLIAGNSGSTGQSNTSYANIRGLFATIPTWSSLAARITLDVALGDFDGDGDLDIVFANDGGPGGQENTVYLNEDGVISTTPAWISGPANQTHAVAVGDIDNDGDDDLVFGNGVNPGDSNTVYLGKRNPVFKSDPISPASHLSNNSAFVRQVLVEQTSANARRVRFDAIDVESDPIWVVVDYQYLGEPTWIPVADQVGPLATSPTGITHTFDWDITLLPIDERDAALRLRVISIPRRVAYTRHIASYVKTVGRLTPVRPEIVSSVNSIDFGPTTVGDSLSADVVITNTGSATLVVTDVEFPSPDMWLGREPPFTIPVLQKDTLTVYFKPAHGYDNLGGLQIRSNDPTNPSETITIVGNVSDLEFDWVSLDLYPTRELAEGQEVAIQVIVDDRVGLDSLVVSYREGGEGVFHSSKMIRTQDNPSNDRYLCFTPGTAAGTRGLDVYVSAYNGWANTRIPAGYVESFRVRIKNQFFDNPGGHYRMVSLPFELPQHTAWGLLSDDLSTYDILNWRFFMYEPRLPGYVELPDTISMSIEQGGAYWLMTRNAVTIDTTPAGDLLTTPTDARFAVGVEAGWNMIGNPFNFPVAWDSILVDKMTMMEATDSMAVAGPYRWIVAEARYNNQMSERQTTLEPFDGYFVWASRNVTLHVPPIEASDSLVVAPVSLLPLAADDQEKGEWIVEIQAASDIAKDVGNYLGVLADAGNGRDPVDWPAPPMSPDQSLFVYFPHSEWSQHARLYTTDMRGSPPAMDGDWGHVWNFDIAKNYNEETAGDEVLLTFSGVESIPEEASVLLIDRALARQLDLRSRAQYRFYLGKKRPVSLDEQPRFGLLVGSEAFIAGRQDELPAAPGATVLHPNYPNPFNPSTIIRYELARPGRVTLRVYDVSGALVRVLEDADRLAGRYEVGWNGESEQGERVASGVYFCRLVTVEFSQTRKMIVLK